MKNIGFAIWMSLWVFWGCGPSAPLLPKATGVEGDLLLVVDAPYWENHPIGDSLKQFFQREFVGLPQVEPTWKLAHVKGDDFNQGFARNRNIFMAVIQEDQPGIAPFIEWGEDVYAKGQLICRIVASDPGHWLQFFSTQKAEIHARFRAWDMRSLKQRIMAQPSKSAMDTLRTRMGISMVIDDGFVPVFVRKNVVVSTYEAIRREDGMDLQVSKGLMAARMPYVSVEMFQKENLGRMCDSLTAMVYHGEKEGSVMMIEPRMVTDSAYVDFDGRYAMELRGLWRMSAEIKGGPFLMYAVHDAAKNELVVLHGFIFSPGVDKRQAMLQLEAMLRSAKW